VIRFAWGELELSVLDGGRLRLDGGAMFGVVPRPLWERQRPVDERHRITLAMNLLLIDDGRTKTIVDTGAGEVWGEKERDIYALEPRSAAEILAPAGLAPAQIDRVVCTHLHFDHAGGNVERGADGALAPAFPAAEYVVQRGEIETARWDNERIRASYRPECYEPLLAAGQLRLVEGNVALDRAVELLVAPGHTPHMQLVLVVTGEGTVAFLADLVPTASHLPYPWIMAYDLEPLATLAVKKRLLPRAVREGWRVVLEHDTDLPLAQLFEDGGRIRASAVLPEA
jgi:glyoxylase-like metal-dependent hydrolase (beta-lactamase superfamily II)